MNLKKDKNGNEYITKAGAFFMMDKFVNQQLTKERGKYDTGTTNKKV